MLPRLAFRRFLLILGMALGVLGAGAAAAGGALVFDSIPTVRATLSGPVGSRMRANVEQWLLRAPQSNPGMIGMFRVRDRDPVPQLVPWAGEFVGKYLVSAIPALRLSEDPRLPDQVRAVIEAFVSTQAEDGYLGPFPRADRLLKHWDLWGHYHALEALLLWHEQTGDARALAAARRAADLVCRIYLEGSRRVSEAGDPEMNMAILTGMAMLHRVTGEPRYLRMAREVERDWEGAGDYLRAGLDGREFHQSPRPRWESLHDLQGLVELWRITGDPRYREAFVHHWRSVRRWDRRNTGGFSSGEQATGNPYAPTAIETCCTVAWMVLTRDYLRLTGDPEAADDLELATLNAGLGAQHPSGRWWTYNTPMDGVREASAHTIVFQARAGTPELNCCSVNGPRVLSLLADWAVMSGTNGLVLNWLGAGRFVATLPDGTPVTVTCDSDAWLTGRAIVQVETAAAGEFELKVRLPSWAGRVSARLNGAEAPDAAPGRYASFRRRWNARDRLELDFELPVRSIAGANEAAGRISLYRGPVLLAFDPAEDPFDETQLPPVDLLRLGEARVRESAAASALEDPLRAWLVVEVPGVDGRPVRLVDFASAGARGTRYRTWLPARPELPSPAMTRLPADGARLSAGPVRFAWRGAGTTSVVHRVELCRDEGFAPGRVWATNVQGTKVVLDPSSLASAAGTSVDRWWWRVVSVGPGGEVVAAVPPAGFVVDASAPRPSAVPESRRGPGGELMVHSLRDEAAPEYGILKSAAFTARGAEGTEVNGRDEMLVYAMPVWPEDDFSVSLRVRVRSHPVQRIGQVFSAWAASMDDPLRLVIDGGRLFARVEAGGGSSTPGAPIETGRWYAIAAVKQGGTLTLHVDGRSIGSCPVPEIGWTRSRACALGGNPLYSGSEFLAAAFADFRFYDRALSAAEIGALAGAEPPAR